MVTLKLFQSDRNSSRPSTSPGYAPDETYFGELSREPHLDPVHLYPASPSPALPSPVLNAGRSLDVSHHFEQIEKQFEDLHQNLGPRPLSSQSSLAPNVPNVPGRRLAPRAPNCRHIDLMDALASSEHHRQESSPPPISPPASPYNEDVAERNMTRFLRIQHRSGLASCRILSALYQEDVADRNIAKYGGPTRSLSSLSSWSSPPAPGRVRKLSPDAQKRNPRKSNWTSDGDLRSRSSPDDASSKASDSSNHLRLQRSAPSLSAEADDSEDDEAVPPVIQRLGVPPAYKQGRRWSNTPLPDSPTLPPGEGDDVDCDKGSKPEAPSPVLQPPSPAPRSSSLGLRSISPPPSSGSTSRKNVRDLSINTQLASKGRPKIGHRAIQPPTPSSNTAKRAPSIAEVMNSPLPVQTPTSAAAPSPRFKVSEMMDLFKQAYMSTHSLSSHPTYESIQDAIVREINSHDAFKRVPVPATAGPLFTPSDEASFASANPGLNRSASAGQFSKIMRKGSFKKHKRNSESSRSISTSVPSRGYDRLLRKVSGSPTRRRHTDAPAPSPGLLAEFQNSKENAVPQTSSGEQLTYMDVLLRAGNDQPGSKIQAASTSNIPATRSTTPVSTVSNPFGTVYCMQAHSTPSKDSRSSMSIEDSDDDIIHLPSIGALPPRVQIEGVDENNVRYVIDGATATDAQSLMSWPQRLRRVQPSQSFCENSLSPLSRARMQLRGARSVETY